MNLGQEIRLQLVADLIDAAVGKNWVHHFCHILGVTHVKLVSKTKCLVHLLLENLVSFTKDVRDGCDLALFLSLVSGGLFGEINAVGVMRIDRVTFLQDGSSDLLRLVHVIETGSLLLGHNFGLDILGFRLLGHAAQSSNYLGWFSA